MSVYTTCPYNTKTWRTTGSAYSFTDTIAGTTLIKKTHMDKLRTAINEERYRRNKEVSSDYTFTDATIAGTTLIKKAHIDDVRAAITSTNGMTCTSDTAVAESWTDSTIAGTTAIKKVHIDEARTAINALRAQCACNCEFCNYCADCGNMAACGCDDHAGGECSYSCSARNSGITTQNPPTAWCVHSAGNDWDAPSTAYGCMCTPNSHI